MVSCQEQVVLHVRPRKEGDKEIVWKDFQGDSFPPYSIALDGFVAGPPAIDYQKPCVNLNHHEGVVGFATRATCEQTRVALDMGLFKTLMRKDGRPYAHVFVDDCDQDVCLSWYELSRYPHLKGPLLTRLVQVQGLLDMSAGSYEFDPDAPILREFAWIFEPYVEARMSGRLFTMASQEMQRVIELVCARIDAYMLGNGQKLSLDDEYEVLRSGTGWKLVRMKGYYARLKMRTDGIMTYVSYRGETSEGNVICSIGAEPFVPARLPELFDRLSAAEPDGRKWGGRDTIGATPKRIGSALSIDIICEIVERHMKSSL